MLSSSSRSFGARGIKYLFLALLALSCGGLHKALASSELYELNHAAVMLKNPSATPLIAITVSGQRLFAAGPHGVVLFSSDSGATWRQALVPVDVTLTSLYFKSATEGWAVGHFGVILMTKDGGLTWTRVLDGLDVIKASNDAAAQAKSTAPGTPDAQLKLRVATAYQLAGPSKPFLTVGLCGNGILAAGQQDLAMFSADGGKNWKQWTSAINNPTFNNIYAIGYVGGVPILAGENGLLLKGDTNCQNFQPISGPYTATLFGIVNKSPASLLVYGIDGGVYLSADDGTSWNTVSLGTDSVIDSGLLLNSGQMLLGQLNGNLALSDANLQNFRPISVSVPFQIAGMAVAPDGNIVVVGNGGVSTIPAASIR